MRHLLGRAVLGGGDHAGGPRPTAAVPVENPYCSCKADTCSGALQRKGKQMDMKSYLKQMHPQECEWDQRDDDAMCGCVIYLSCRSLSHLKQELDAL